MGFVDRNQENLLSKIATGNGHGENSPYFDGWKAFEKDPFHAKKNPRGVIQMGLAENQVSMLINFVIVGFSVINLKHTLRDSVMVVLC